MSFFENLWGPYKLRVRNVVMYRFPKCLTFMILASYVNDNTFNMPIAYLYFTIYYIY